MDLGLYVEETRDTGELRTHVAEITNMPVGDVGTLSVVQTKGITEPLMRKKEFQFYQLVPQKLLFFFAPFRSFRKVTPPALPLNFACLHVLSSGCMSFYLSTTGITN